MSNTACGLFERPSLWHAADLLFICPSKSHAQIISGHLEIRNKSMNGWTWYISAVEERSVSGIGSAAGPYFADKAQRLCSVD